MTTAKKEPEGEWKVQFSKKVNNDMWNFRGQTVPEVKAMIKEALGTPAPASAPAPTGATDADTPSETAEAPADEGSTDGAVPSETPMTPLEKARAKMKAKEA